MNGSHPETTPVAPAWRVAGLARPAPGWWRWMADGHVLAALVAAVPVWAVLGASLGAQMQAPAGRAAWIGFVLLQPAAEELAFRGVLQGWLLRRTAAKRVGPFSRANVLASLAFATLHLATQPVPWALAVLAPSLVFGHLRDRLGSVLPGIAMHAAYNAGFASLAWWVHG